MIEEVEGIVISVTDYGETSKILNVLTKKYGIIGVISKGCKKLKSDLRSVSDRLTYGKFNIFYKENKFVKLAERKNFINLMQVIKNYYGIKTDIGLFNAYEFFNVKQPKEQDHNALNDAVATADIFKLFQKELNTDTIE